MNRSIKSKRASRAVAGVWRRCLGIVPIVALSLLVGLGIPGCSSTMKTEQDPSSNASTAMGVESYQEGQIIRVKTRTPISFDDLMQKTKTLDVIYLGEEHHHRHHIENARNILRALLAQGKKPQLRLKCLAGMGSRLYIPMSLSPR